jgi:hypothetical protein
VQKKYLFAVKSVAYAGVQKSIRGAMCIRLQLQAKLVGKAAPEPAHLAI